MITSEGLTSGAEEGLAVGAGHSGAPPPAPDLVPVPEPVVVDVDVDVASGDGGGVNSRRRSVSTCGMVDEEARAWPK